MKLGILVTTDRHLDDIVGLTKAAVSKGHEVLIFNTDDGVKLVGNPKFNEMCKIQGVTMSFCDHSTEKLGVSKEGVPADVTCGSQYNNASMMHDADRVVNL